MTPAQLQQGQELDAEIAVIDEVIGQLEPLSTGFTPGGNKPPVSMRDIHRILEEGEVKVEGMEPERFRVDVVRQLRAQREVLARKLEAL